ncbi:MAG: adenylosuccinate synthetase [Candidatus Microgenomates bacterium]
MADSINQSKNCRSYIEFIEKFTGIPVKYISVGPKLEQTIIKP